MFNSPSQTIRAFDHQQVTPQPSRAPLSSSPMAGITSTFPIRPSLYKTRSTFFPSSYFFGLRLLHHHPITSTTTIPVSLASRITSISARSGGGYYRRSPPPAEEDQALDISSIGSDQVRLIDEQQNMVGIVSKSMALQMAEDAELDLVILSPDADPPVLRIMDYDKYRYEQQKKKKEQQKKSAASRMDLKELKMGYNIDVHDYSVRLRQAQKFLRDGDKVKVIVNLKGRENEFRNNAIELLERFQSDLGELATRENKNFKDRNVFIILVPNKVIVQKAQEEQKKKDKSVAAEVSANV